MDQNRCWPHKMTSYEEMMTDDECKQALRDHGFLADVVKDFPAQYRQVAAGCFDMAENFSEIGQRVVIRAMSQD